MIRFTKYTQVDKVVPKPKNFPRFVYNLVPFSEIPSHVNSTARFLDVIGYVTAISNVTKVFSGNKLQLRRNITIKDRNGDSLQVSLIGQRAMEFPEQMVLKIAKQSPVIVIFVGMLMKTGFLSGSAACRWYINEEIEDIQRFYESLPLEIEDMQIVQQQSEDQNVDKVQKKTLL
ncbi:hypothetical protein PVAP13_9KG027320 [Panicum virgatum]|uniref:Replication protein A OB domain-containing protein n=1 Tax=Panicum virgatum TaxID=38727 RepID=A0A8T0N633_PANVG|nr:hypothetical protein PVAP13_9KG027320 [Panicum virgatum]